MASTLHQLILAPRFWDNIPKQIAGLWQPDDALILLGEAAQGIQDERLVPFGRCYLLQADAEILGMDDCSADYQIISYHDWAQLVLKHSHHITWK